MMPPRGVGTGGGCCATPEGGDSALFASGTYPAATRAAFWRFDVEFGAGAAIGNGAAGGGCWTGLVAVAAPGCDGGLWVIAERSKGGRGKIQPATNSEEGHKKIDKV